jgi:hypothetical protein
MQRGPAPAPPAPTAFTQRIIAPQPSTPPSVRFTHSTQRAAPAPIAPAPVWQKGVATPASPPVVRPVQSLSVAQATQAFRIVSQTGAAAVVHSAFVRQPATHACVFWLHTGIAELGQSLLARQATHCPLATSQWDVLPTQAVESAAVHWTQRCVVASHTGAPVEQAPVPVVIPGMHPTQAPVVVSQTLAPAPPPQVPPSAVQEAWQRSVVGEHTDVLPVQAAAWPGRHCKHRFVAVSHTDAFMAVQLVFDKQQFGPGFGQTAAVEVDAVPVPTVLPLPLLVGWEPLVVPLPPTPVLALPLTVELLPPVPPSGVKLGAELPPHPPAMAKAPAAIATTNTEHFCIVFMEHLI